MLKIISLTIILMVSTLSMAQSASCNNVAGAEIAVGTNCNFTAMNSVNNTSYWSGASGCGASDNDDVWAWFTATGTSTTITYDPAAADDIAIHLFDGNCNPNMNELTCANANGAGGNETITYATTPGTVYRIRIQKMDGNRDDPMNGQVCITSPCPIDMTVGTTMFSQAGLTTCGAGDDFDSGDVCGTSYMNGDDYTIEWTPNTTQCVDINLSNTGTWVGLILSDDCPSLPTANCLGGTTSSAGNPTFTGLSVTAGTTYYITISTFPAPQCTPFDIEVVACPLPTSNDCNGGTTICSDATFNGNATGAGSVGDLTAANRGCLGIEHQSSWYYFEVATNGNLELVIETTVDYDFALWGPYADVSDCPPTQAPVRCSFAAGGGNTGMVNGSGDNTEGSLFGDRYVNGIGVTAGQTFILLIDNFDADGTDFNLNWNFNSGATLDCTPLPIVFSDFAVTAYNTNNIINWNTYKEENNSHFLVQKRDENGEYYTIETIYSTEDSDETKPYVVTDRNVEKIVNYYRILQVDVDGKTKIYEPKSIDNRANKSDVIKTYNMMGQEVDAFFKGVVIQLHNDGSTTKVYQNPE